MNLKEVCMLSTMYYFMHGILYHTHLMIKINLKVILENLANKCTKQWCELTNSTYQKGQGFNKGKDAVY